MDGLNITPAYRLVANDQDITTIIRDRFKALRLTDEAGATSDTLEITLADHDPARPIKLPPTGAELELSLGYDDKVREVGLFVCDEVELSGWPGELTIRARAAPYEETGKGRTGLQTQKTRSWKEGTTLGAMVRVMAQEHGLEPTVSDSLASIKLPHTDQSSESDMNLLLRLAKRYDALAKPAGGHLLFVKRGEAKSVGGVEMPRIAVAAKECTDFRVTIARRESPGTVVAYYRVTRSATRFEVAVGGDEPVTRLRMQYRDEASALAAARAEQSRRARAAETLGLTLPGDPGITAEALLVLGEGFRDGVAGEWLVTRAEHYIGPGGYKTTVEAERPNSNEDVVEVAGGPVRVTAQKGSIRG